MIATALMWYAVGRISEAKGEVQRAAVTSVHDYEAIAEAEEESDGIPVTAWLATIILDGYAFSVLPEVVSSL